MPDFLIQSRDDRTARYSAAGVPEDMALAMANLPLRGRLTEIVRIAGMAGVSPLAAGKAFYGVTGLFRIGRIETLARQIVVSDYFEALAVERAVQTLDSARRGLTLRVLGDGEAKEPFKAWQTREETAIGKVARAIEDIMATDDLTVSRVVVAANTLGDLAAG